MEVSFTLTQDDYVAWVRYLQRERTARAFVASSLLLFGGVSLFI